MTEIEMSEELLNAKNGNVKNGCPSNHHDEMDVEFEGTSSSLPVPNDRYLMVFGIFLLHGVGVLLPWNVFINAFSYFQEYKFNTTESRDADYNKFFLNYIGIASQLPNILLSAVNVFFQSSGNSSKQGIRFIVAVLVNIATLIFTIVLAMIDTSEWPYGFFILTIISVVILNSCTGIYQSFIFGLAALLPMRYSNAVVIGNNLCGTLVALCNIITKVAAGAGTKDADGSSLRTGAIYYFVFAVVILLLCFDTYFVLPYLRFYKFFTRNEDEPKKNKLLGNGDVGDHRDEDEEQVKEKKEKEQSVIHIVRSCFGLCCFCPIAKGKSVCARYWDKYRRALPHCWCHCLSVFSVFFCTLSAFPALTASVKPISEHFFIPPVWFTDITCFFLFNLCALIGNLISNFLQKPGPRWLFIPVWIRTLFFIPFFMLCNGSPDKRVLPVVVANDWVYVIGMIIFAISSGYLSSLCMMYASLKVPDDLKSIAGMLAAFCLVFGVFSGVQFSLLWSKIVEGFQ